LAKKLPRNSFGQTRWGRAELGEVLGNEIPANKMLMVVALGQTMAVLPQQMPMAASK
jgi:hypothetical protein